jgi:hypothetical protein
VEEPDNRTSVEKFWDEMMPKEEFEDEPEPSQVELRLETEVLTELDMMLTRTLRLCAALQMEGRRWQSFMSFVGIRGS